MAAQRVRARAALGTAALAVVMLGLVVAVTVPGRPGTSGRAPAPVVDAFALDAAHRFLDRYVEPDGRVVRRDQGSDTVSEGQAYALLLAVAVDSEEMFGSVWTWTVTHLGRPDGLLSWRWVDGRIADPASAADADLDAARALVLAGERFSEPSYTAAGVRLGRAVLDHETVLTPMGRILTAGTWAAGSSPPWTVNPSYSSPVAAALLHAASADSSWPDVARTDRAVLTTLMAKTALPPDWATVDATGDAISMPGPGSDAVASSYDAARIAPRYAESCDPPDRRLAASLVAELEAADRTHAVSWVALAAAQAAAGEDDAARTSLHRASQLDEEQPTYYGAAWTALGTMMLIDTALGGCPPMSAGSGDGLDDR